MNSIHESCGSPVIRLGLRILLEGVAVRQGGLEQGQQQQQQRRGTTPVLQQSHMQLSLGMGLGLTLDLGSWHYGMAPGGDAAAGGAVIPRVTAATHRRRAGAPVEEFASEQVTSPLACLCCLPGN